jgi:hypothetical protein
MACAKPRPSTLPNSLFLQQRAKTAERAKTEAPAAVFEDKFQFDIGALVFGIDACPEVLGEPWLDIGDSIPYPAGAGSPTAALDICD